MATNTDVAMSKCWTCTDKLISVTITSILRVTAVANSVHNQRDQTWNFIERGIWSLIEANLGIICACLIVLKQVVKRYVLRVFGSTRETPKADYGYGDGGNAGPADRNSKRNTRKHFRLNNVVDDEVGGERMTNDGHVWSDSKAYQMTSVVYRGELDDGRRSDEERIVSICGANRDPSHKSSVDSLDIPPRRPLHQGITKKVDVHIDSHRVSPVDRKG
jgi:hypothetical protein